jgi:hypothetical protein
VSVVVVTVDRLSVCLILLERGFLVPGRARLADERGYVGGREEVFVGLGGGSIVALEPYSIDETATFAGARDVGEAMILDPDDRVRAAGGGAILERALH